MSKKFQEVEIRYHFLDSGAFSMKKESMKYAQEHNGDEAGFYQTSEFIQFMDDYAEFVKEYDVAIDYYSNMDVIGNPVLTYENQKYLEGKGISPVPVVHYGSKMKWLERYISEGYDYISLGGLVGQRMGSNVVSWIDRCFDIVCDTADRFPKVKIHGFGMTSYKIMARYPWYSVDSSSWARPGINGKIIVPKLKKGEWDFSRHATVGVTIESMKKGKDSSRFWDLPEGQREIVMRWLQEIKVPFGESDLEGKVVVEGVCNSYRMRHTSTILFFERMKQNFQEWPWPWQLPKRRRILI